MYFLGRGLCRVYLRLTGGYSSYGKANIPPKGGFLIAPNHISYLDPPVVGSGIPRMIHFMAKEPLFRIPVIGPFIRSVGTFPVRQGTADRAAIRRAIELLADGRVVCIFPEGTRSPDANLLTPVLGFAMIALKSRIPIVPTAIFGSEKSLSHKHPLPRFAHVKVVYGQPMTFDDLYDNPDREAQEEVGRRVMNTISKMLEQEPK